MNTGLRTATCWHLADDAVYFCPPETRAEVEARFGQAAEPFEQPAADCRTCAHLCLDAICDDIERLDARLPADGGAGCVFWEPR